MEISQEDYIKCINQINNLKMLETAVYNALRLNYDGTRLNVADDSGEIATLFKYANPALYEQKFNELQFKKEQTKLTINSDENKED